MLIAEIELERDLLRQPSSIFKVEPTKKVSPVFCIDNLPKCVASVSTSSGSSISQNSSSISTPQNSSPTLTENLERSPPTAQVDTEEEFVSEDDEILLPVAGATTAPTRLEVDRDCEVGRANNLLDASSAFWSYVGLHLIG